MSNLLWPYPDNRERNELIMIGLRHPVIEAKIQARQSVRPGVPPVFFNGLLWALGIEMIVGVVVLWWLS